MTQTEIRKPSAVGQEPGLRKDGRRQRREDQLAARARLEAAERQRRRLIWGGGIALAVVALGALVYWLVRPEPGPQIQSFPNQGQVHIPHGQNHPPYNSLPPTSGWHYADAVAPWGLSTTQIPDEVQVHDLEHGGILVQYDCADGCPDTVKKLESILSSYPAKVIVAPYPGTGHKVTLTAWTKLAYLDNVDEAFIRRFINRYKDHGPEFVPDMPS